MYIRPAHQEDLTTIVRWRREAAAWLAERGSDQWSDAGLSEDQFTDRVTRSIAAGETWLAVTDDGAPVGTIALDQWADPGLWPDEQLAQALVIHRMIIDRSAKGGQVGEVLLQHADQVAAGLGRTWLLLDAWSSNSGLHAYYRRAGFEYVRTVPGFASGALFQRPVQAAATAAPTITAELEERFRERQVSRGAAEYALAHIDRPLGSAGPDIEHAALAAELREVANLYRQASEHVPSPLLLTALDAAARQASALADTHDRAATPGPRGITDHTGHGVA